MHFPQDQLPQKSSQQPGNLKSDVLENDIFCFDIVA